MNYNKKRRRLSSKIIVMFIVMVTVTCVAIGFVIYNTSNARIIGSANEVALGTGRFVTKTLNINKIGFWLENGADAEYRETAEKLADLNTFYGLQNIYVFLPLFDEYGNMRHDTLTVFDVTRENDGSVVNYELLGTEVKDIDVYEQVKQVYESRTYLSSDIITLSEYGWLCSGYYPVIKNDGSVAAIVGIDVEMGMIRGNVIRETAVTVALIFALIALFVIIFIIFIRRSVIRPVKMLSEHMSDFVSGSGDLNYRELDSIRTNDEIEQMSDAFNSMTGSIILYTENLEKTTMEKERMKADLDVSMQIRASLSNGTEYPAFPDRTDFELYASMKNTVFNKSSFCDCFMTDEDHIFLVVGESAGRSLAAMLYAMLAATNIRCFAGMGYDPLRIAAQTNNELCGQNMDKELTVNAVIAKINLRSGVMKYVNAGMPPVLLKKTGEDYSYELSPRRFNLGEMPNVSFFEETVRLAQGNAVMLMSNGIPGMKSGEGVEFTEAYVASEINRISAVKYELKAIADELESILDEFRGNAPVEFDTSLIMFRYFG